LPAQKRRFLVHIQVDEARVIHLLARGFSAGWVQLLLQDGGADFRAISSGQLSLWNR
jgi:hypothetical protein